MDAVNLNEIILNRCDDCGHKIYGTRFAVGCKRCSKMARYCRSYISDFIIEDDETIYKGYLALHDIVNGKKDCKCKKGDIFQYNNLDYQWVCKSCKKVTVIPHKWILNKSITSKMLCRLFPSDFTYLEWDNVKIMTEVLTNDYITKA